jgi:NAD(P)-dependent dehydrogenase (short-subunit alcohol dehydrogenase family)
MAAEHGGRVAFVTGAASGIGRAAAEALVARGWAVALVDRDEKAGPQVEAELRKTGEAVFIPCDVTDDAGVRRAVERTVRTWGRLDAAFNAAGADGEKGKAVADSSVENWNRVIALNLTGVWSCMRHQIPALLASGGGSIVNCSSVAGLVGAPFLSAYVAAKHGVVGLTRGAALEYGRQGIRVNAICPAMIDTPMSRKFMDPEISRMMISQSPLGRFAAPSEVASAVLWLFDDASGFVTGQAIAIDGGWTAR